MSRFWPAADPRQQAYERLRTAVLASGRLPDELAAARFARFSSRQDESFAAKVSAALREQFGGHAIKTSGEGSA